MTHRNVYDDAHRAASYAELEFPGTYYLAYRDLPELIRRHVSGQRAIDFGCGAGRSTRFVRQFGFETVGVDISPPMIDQARALDPEGDYRLVAPGDLPSLGEHAWDLVLCAFTFDNIPTGERKVRILGELRELLTPTGRILTLNSTPEIYTHEWASFSTRDYPENRTAGSGDVVRIIMTDVKDRRPVEDILWTDESYHQTFAEAGLRILETHWPMARKDEPYEWVNETHIAPWVVYVLGL